MAKPSTPPNAPELSSNEQFKEFHERNSGQTRFLENGVVVPEVAVRHGVYVQLQGDGLARVTVHQHGRPAFMDLDRHQARYIAALLLAFAEGAADA